MNRRFNTRRVEKIEARNYLRKAEAFLKQAEEARELATHDFERSAAGTPAVLAAIAAADSVCGIRLGTVWAGAHAQAPAHLKKVAGASKAATSLGRVIREKTTLEYRAESLTSAKLDSIIKQATDVVEFARMQF